MPGQWLGGTPKHLHPSKEPWEKMKRCRRWSQSIILFSSYSCHMAIGTEVLDESALLSPFSGHSFFLQPPLPIRKGIQGKPGFWQGARQSWLSGKFDVAAITYCPCSYPVYARGKSFVNKCKELMANI